MKLYKYMEKNLEMLVRLNRELKKVTRKLDVIAKNSKDDAAKKKND